MRPVTLTTERLLLRPLTASDADAVFVACQDPDIQRWTRLPSPYQREHAEDFVHRVSPEGWRDDTLYTFGVFTKVGGEARGEDLVGTVGLVGLTPARLRERIAELGFWTVRGKRRQGLTTEAARAVTRWAFTELGVSRLEWIAEVGNEGSRAVARALGFTMEGVQRARLTRGDVRRDAWSAALLPSDLGLPSVDPYLPARG